MKKTYIDRARLTMLALIKTKQFSYDTAFALIDGVKVFDRIKAEEVTPEWEEIQKKSRYIREQIEAELQDRNGENKEELIRFLHANHEGMPELDRAWNKVMDSEVKTPLPVIALSNYPELPDTMEVVDGEAKYNIPLQENFKFLVEQKIIVITKKSKK